MAYKKNTSSKKTKKKDVFDADDIEEISLDSSSEKKENSKKKKKTIDKKKVYKTTAKVAVRCVIALSLTVVCVIIGLLMGVVVGCIITTDPLEINIDDYKSGSKATNNVTYVYNAKNEVIAELTWREAGSTSEWEDIENIPKDLQDAFVAIEDERFYEHNGVDLKRTLSAIAAYVVPGMSSHGGSTITQQVVKNFTGEDDRSIPRKVREQWRALQLERDMEKEEILEFYLNIIYFANGAYGVHDAAVEYFGKHVSELTLAECSFLAGITNNPGKYNPYTTLGRANAYKRQVNILDAMLNQGFITKAEYIEAIQTELVFDTGSSSDDSSGEGEAVVEVKKAYTYFVDMVISDVRKELIAAGYTKNQANDLIYRSGAKIYTTQDPDIQKIVDEEYCNQSNFPVNGPPDVSDEDNAQSAIVIMDQHTGHVTAIYGGYGEKKESLTWNRATSMQRQPGSAIKPILVYAPLVDMGKITAGYAMDEEPAYLDNQNPEMLWPTNSDHVNHGLVPVRTALNRSYNIFAVNLYKGNVKSCLAYMKSLGIDRSDETHLSLALGGFTKGVSPMQMAAAYVPFANGGTYYEPITFTKILSKTDEIIIDKTTVSGTSVYKQESTSSMMTSLLTTVVSDYRSTGHRAQLTAADGSNMPTAGKTGTTSDVRDFWFVGYSPYYTCAVWYGYDNQTVISGDESAAAIKIWKKVMQRIHDNLESKAFEVKGEFITTKICTISGKKPTQACWDDPRCSRLIIDETFVAGTQPTEYCDIHTTKNVCTSGTDKYGKYYLATSNCKSVTRKNGTYRKSIPDYLIYLDKSDYPEDWSYELSHSYCPNCG